MDFINAFTPAVIAAQWEEVYSNRMPYLGEGLFPARKKAGLDLAWLKGAKGLPVSLMPSAFDAKATFRDRIGFSKLETEMPFFREGFKIKEKDRQDLMRVQDSNDPYAAQIIGHVFDDANQLIEGAAVVPERMRMSLLFAEGGNAGIAIKANGVDYTYNYDPDGTWKTANYKELLSNAKWDQAATADPFADIEERQTAARTKNGTELVHLVMTTATFNTLCKVQAIKDRFLTTTGRAIAYLTGREVAAVIRDTLGVDIILYDKMYKDESGVAHAFAPDGYVALIPAGNLGDTWYGTTPEEADLRASGKAEVSIVNTGVALSREIQQHPVNINLFASEIVLPSYERMDDVHLMKVY